MSKPPYFNSGAVAKMRFCVLSIQQLTDQPGEAVIGLGRALLFKGISLVIDVAEKLVIEIPMGAGRDMFCVVAF